MFPKNHALHTARYGMPRSALDHDQHTHSTLQSLTVSAAVWPPLPAHRVSLSLSLSLSVYAWCLIPTAVNCTAVPGGRLLHTPAERGKTPTCRLVLARSSGPQVAVVISRLARLNMGHASIASCRSFANLLITCMHSRTFLRARK